MTSGDGTAPDRRMLNDWHVVRFSSELQPGALHAAQLLGRDLVLWRDRAGDAHVWEDLCVHRGSRLSRGCVVEDTVVCPYHGWRYDSSARCVGCAGELNFSIER